MKTLLLYATNSGSTIEASNNIASEFTAKSLEITVKDVRESEPSELDGYDLIILGSPTYDEGNMHDLFLRFFEKFGDKTLPGKKFAVFGLGDTSYAHYCGSADHLKDSVNKVGGTLIAEPLKINNYYFNMQEELAKITEWTQKILAQST